MRIEVAVQRAIASALSNPFGAREVPFQSQLRAIHFHTLEVPRRAASEVVVADANFLQVADLNGLHHEFVRLIALELVRVGLALLQGNDARVVLFAEEDDEDVGVGASSPLVTGDHVNMVRCCGS